MSRVERTARTTQEKHEKERAEHECYSDIHDEVYDAFRATIQKLDEDESLPEDTAAQDDQEDETEQSLSESLQTRRQISRIHENMGHPSNRTLVRVFRLGGAKHRCGACEAQERPASPIVSRSPTSFVFNDVVGLDLFFLSVFRNNGLRSYGRPRILVIDQQRSLCSGIFAEKVEKHWGETRSDTAGDTVEEWQDRTCGQELEGRLLQNDTRRPRSTDVDRF